MMAVPALVTGLVGATSKSSSSSSAAIFYLFIIIAVAFYFFILRPQQRKAKALREQQNTFEVGDEVLTAGGLVGEVLDIDGDRVTLETSVGASFVVLRQYVLRRLEEPHEVDDELDEESDDDTEASVDDDHQADDDRDADDGHDPIDLDGHRDQRSRGSGGAARRTGTDDRDDTGDDPSNS